MGYIMGERVVIQALNLTKFYGEILAVDHISFEVERGEVFVFLGPNGAGKTTTIGCLQVSPSRLREKPLFWVLTFAQKSWRQRGILG